jgi:DNA-binding Lrp family transcriptional regulator
MNDIVMPRMDATDRRLVVATQAGLPLEPEPYTAVARAVGVAPEEVMQRLRRMLDTGVIRRIGAVPNHYALGYRANAMTVWDVDDARVEDLGVRVGALRFVSHCYLRPRVPPAWRYNLFAMVHGRDREEAAGKIEAIAAMLGDACRSRDVLYSMRILKKTGVRLTETN